MNEFEKLCALVARLREADGCPWDREQTNANLREELGDLLLIILMQAQIASEANRFSIDDVTRAITEKLIRRHPHVFGGSTAQGSEAVVKQWEAIKQDEKKGRYFASLPAALPALMRAEKVQKEAARLNFDWKELGDVLGKVNEELSETKDAIESAEPERIADEIGDLQLATDKFIARFGEMEKRLRQRGGKLGQANLGELDAIWNEIKSEMASSSVPATA